MGKHDALETDRIQLTYPSRWNKRLDAVKDVYGALSRQDVIRAIVASVLFPEECHVEKREKEVKL